MSEKPYYEFAGFDQIYLEDSYLEGLRKEEGTIVFEMLFVLRERHPQYKPPVEGEQYCYRKGLLVFRNVTQANWSEFRLEISRDPDGSVDYGNIHSLVARDGSYLLSGDCGLVKIQSACPVVELRDGA